MFEEKPLMELSNILTLNRFLLAIRRIRLIKNPIAQLFVNENCLRFF